MAVIGTLCASIFGLIKSFSVNYTMFIIVSPKNAWAQSNNFIASILVGVSRVLGWHLHLCGDIFVERRMGELKVSRGWKFINCSIFSAWGNIIRCSSDVFS